MTAGRILEAIWFIAKLIFDWRSGAIKDKKKFLSKTVGFFRRKSPVDDLSDKGYEEEDRLKKKWQKMKKKESESRSAPESMP